MVRPFLAQDTIIMWMHSNNFDVSRFENSNILEFCLRFEILQDLAEFLGILFDVGRDAVF